MLGDPGSRPQNGDLRAYHVTVSESLIAKSSELEWVIASVVNAVGCYRKAENGNRAMLSMRNNCTHFTKLGKIGKVFRKIGFKCTVKKPEKRSKVVVSWKVQLELQSDFG